MKQLLFILLCLITKVNAQEIGIRLGNFNDAHVAIDGIVNFEDGTRLHGDISFGQGIGANLLYNFKIDEFAVDNLNFQYYLGAGIATFVGDPFVLGANGEIGIEYLFKNTPITIGIDWRPQLNVITRTSLEILQLGINIRYRINEL